MIYIPIFVNIVLLLLFDYRRLFFSLFRFMCSLVEAFRKPAAESGNRERRLSFPLCVCPRGKYGGPLS